ncbi:MAG TPA: DUF2147 domain-containing protein [Chitinophagaceae bacterium]|nr:DUF2147 domain-containing protein [Chitinophagaceae bacterium]
MKKRIISLAFSLIQFSLAAVSQSKADDIVGTWLTGGKEPAKIQIYKTGEKFYGKIIWLKYPTGNGKPRTDGNNPDKEKRNNPIVGLVILRDFRFDGDDEWKGGDIYDPESGKTYSCYMYLTNKNTLKVRGYIGLSIFGRTEIWARTN